MRIAVFCGSRPGRDSAFERAAAAAGAGIAAAGWEMIYGGEATGLMKTVADAALAGGARVTGVVPDIGPLQEHRHPGLTTYIPVADMPQRKQAMLQLADAFLCLPGGLGTLDEFGDVMTADLLGLFDKPVVLFNTEGYYNRLKRLIDQMIREGFADREIRRFLKVSGDWAAVKAFLEGYGKGRR